MAMDLENGGGLFDIWLLAGEERSGDAPPQQKIQFEAERSMNCAAHILSSVSCPCPTASISRSPVLVQFCMYVSLATNFTLLTYSSVAHFVV
jgi:hypothetical protein